MVQSNFTSKIIRQGAYESVMWPVFGKIQVKPESVYDLKNRIGKKQIKKHTKTHGTE